ncbi:MAG: aldo/keto reductase [Candidatus Lokiarchaeota archaeon]|nr:aldo/keto reductase [Candidatus Lokiarchaeota archaeon]
MLLNLREKKVKKIKFIDTDIEVTPIGLGVMQFGAGHGLQKMMWKDKIPEDVRIGIVKAALDGGINWFDTAAIYGDGRSEQYLASALKSLGIKDNEVIIADKWMPIMKHASDIKETIDTRLKYLDGYSIDLYQIHQPQSLSPIKEQMNAMADLVETGKIRSVGISNFLKDQMIEAYDALKDRGLSLVTNQMRYSLLYRSIEKDGVLETAKELGMKIITWSPLEEGVLTGKYHKDPSLAKNISYARRMMYPFSKNKLEKTRKLIEAMQEIATRYGATVTQVALNWLINFPSNKGHVVVIPGASKIHHIEQNVGAMYFEMSKDEMEMLDDLSRPYNKMS